MCFRYPGTCLLAPVFENYPLHCFFPQDATQRPSDTVLPFENYSSPPHLTLGTSHHYVGRISFLSLFLSTFSLILTQNFSQLPAPINPPSRTKATNVVSVSSSSRASPLFEFVPFGYADGFADEPVTHSFPALRTLGNKKKTTNPLPLPKVAHVLRDSSRGSPASH